MSEVGPRILVVEDDAPNVRLLTTLLELEGYQVCSATDPAQAITLCEGGAFQLVLTDSFSRTPEDALTATASLRTAAGSIPVILLTAHRLDSRDVCTSGFAGHIGKPYDVNELLTQVQEVLTTAAVS